MLSAWSVAEKVAKVLLDENNIRCTVDELSMWFNSAQREIINIKPDALTANGSVALVAGTKQSAAVVTANSVANTGLRLLNVVRNTGTYSRAIQKRNMKVLDTILPNWHSMTAAAEVKFFMFDELDPLTFYVYPPQPVVSPGTVEALVSIAPTDVTVAVDGLAFTSGQAMSLSELFENNMIDLMLSRALSKDSKNLANMQRSAAHYAAAATSLGQKVQSNRFYAPTSPFKADPQGGTQ
ncbi:MAG: DUF6682 family protein [Desulfuromonadaceae bacterium]